MLRMLNPSVCLAACSLFLTAASIGNAAEVQFDLSGITIQARDSSNAIVPFADASFTGKLQLALTIARSHLNAILVDGADTTSGESLTGLSGAIDLAGGTITGGALSFTITDSLFQHHTFSASLAGNAAGIVFGVSRQFIVTGEAFGGAFTPPAFDSIGLSTAQDASPLSGAFIISGYAPDGAGLSTDASLNVIVNATPVPEPSLIVPCSMALACVAIRRRVHRRTEAKQKQPSGGQARSGRSPSRRLFSGSQRPPGPIRSV
jgi:hypothetical protein